MLPDAGHSHASHSWQQGPLPGQPPARPAKPHADVLFPVVYCLVIGSLCQFAGRLVPFWLLLALLVPSFGFGVHYVVFVGEACNAIVQQCVAVHRHDTAIRHPRCSGLV